MPDHLPFFRRITKRIDQGLILEACGIWILCSFFLYWNLGRLVYIVLALYGIVLLLRREICLPREQWLFSLPIAGFIIANLISLGYHGWPDRGMNVLTSRYFLLLLSVPLVSLLVARAGARHPSWIRYYLGASVVGLLALFDMLILELERAEAGDNAVIFGFVALGLTTVVMGSIVQIKSNRQLFPWFLIALFLGYTAIILSGSRGAWIALAAVIFVTLLYSIDRYSWPKRLTITLGAITVGSLISWNVPLVHERIDQTISSVTLYFSGESERKWTSFSYRIETWRVGWQMGLDNPVFGIGPGHFRKRLIKHAETNPEDAGLDYVRHAHNQYVQTFATSGYVGLVALVTMIGCHLALFARYLAMRYPVEVRACALAGVLLVLGYALLSLTGVPFERKKQLVLYGFSAASLWAGILLRRGELRQRDNRSLEPEAT